MVDERSAATTLIENDRLILNRLMGMLQELPRRECEAVLAGATFMERYDTACEALALARETIGGLAQQQAMPDDFYRATLARIDEVLS